jgi:hypothetical protein
MPNFANDASPEQFAANRANAAHSTGPRSPEGKAHSAQNARKHGFAAADYTVVYVEDAQEVSNLKDNAVDFYQPVNSQELFAVWRIALAQQAILRIARLESGLLTSCLNQAIRLTDTTLAEINPALLANIEVTPTQKNNFLLAGGFQHSAAKSNALSLCLRYSAQAERRYRSAVEDFNRLKALRPELPNEPNPAPQTELIEPAATLDETNPISPKDPQNEGLVSIFAGLPGGSNFQPRHPSSAPAPLAVSRVGAPETGNPSESTGAQPPLADG